MKPLLLAKETSRGARLAHTPATVVCSPLDVVKTRVQLVRTGEAPPLLATASLLVRSEGVSGLYRGFMPRWGHASVWGSIVISLYEYLKVICKKR